jgi:hypothetical protein
MRPIGTKETDPNEGSYLCPNDLILGRASSNVPIGQWDEAENFKKRWKFVQQVINTFWRKWHRDYFPTLIVRQKWHTNKRNLQVATSLCTDRRINISCVPVYLVPGPTFL